MFRLQSAEVIRCGVGQSAWHTSVSRHGKRGTMRCLVIAALLVGCGVHAGCGSQSAAGQPEFAAEGEQFLLAEEPAGAIGILEFREEAAAAGQEELAQPRDIVLLGRIGGGGQSTWS